MRRKEFSWRRGVKSPSYLDWPQPETVNLQGRLICTAFSFRNSGKFRGRINENEALVSPVMTSVQHVVMVLNPSMIVASLSR